MNKRSNGDTAQRTAKRHHRRHRRFRTRNLLIDAPVGGRVVNVGQGGLAVETPQSLTVGETYLFKVRLGDKAMRLSGRIRWCHLTATESNGDSQAAPIYRSGVALREDVTTKAWQEALRRMTEGPAYLIWHRARGNKSGTPLSRLTVEPTPGQQPGQLDA